MREVRSRLRSRLPSGLTGTPFSALELVKGLVEGSEVQTVEERPDITRFVAGGGDPGLYTRVDLTQKSNRLVQLLDQLLVGHAAQRIGEPLELAELPLEHFEIRSFSPILHRIRTIHHLAREIGPAHFPEDDARAARAYR